MLKTAGHWRVGRYVLERLLTALRLVTGRSAKMSQIIQLDPTSSFNSQRSYPQDDLLGSVIICGDIIKPILEDYSPKEDPKNTRS